MCESKDIPCRDVDPEPHGDQVEGPVPSAWKLGIREADYERYASSDLQEHFRKACDERGEAESTFIYRLMKLAESKAWANSDCSGIMKFWPLPQRCDFIQEVVLQLCENDYRRLRMFNGRSTFETYIGTIVGRCAISQLRKEKRKKNEVDANTRPVSDFPHNDEGEPMLPGKREGGWKDPSALTEEELTQIGEEWESGLNEGQRMALDISRSGLEGDEAAQILGMSREAYYTMKHRLKRNFTAFLDNWKRRSEGDMP